MSRRASSLLFALALACSAPTGIPLDPPPGPGDGGPNEPTDGPIVDPSDGGPPDGGFRDGGDGGPPPLEDPGACTMIPYYGQSSSIGVCSGTCTNFGNPPCDVPGGSICNVLSDRDLEGGFQASWDNAANDYLGGVCPLNVRGGARCARGNAEVSAYGMVEQYRRMLGDPPQATITSVAGQSGTSIADLDRGDVPFSPTQQGYDFYYARLIRSIVAARDAVAADPAAYGCNGNLIVRGIAMTQGETDDPQPEGYAERIRTFVDHFCEDVKSVTGQAECPHVSWDQTSGWLANGDALAPTAQRLLDAADPDPRIHSIGAKGQYNPGTPGRPFIGETNPRGVHSWENSGASPLHFSSLTQKHVGRQHGKVLYRGIHLGEDWNGLRMNALTQSGRTLRACFSPVGGRLVRDVLNCPEHWNGADGFEWYQDEIGAPRILSVRQADDRCLELEMSAPVSDVASGRLQAGFRGLQRIGDGEEPENGCRAADGTANHGAPGWTNWRDVDPADFDGDGAAYNWVAIQAKPLDQGGTPSAPDSAAAYLDFDDGNELIEFADDAALATGTLTVSWWAQHTGTADNAVVVSKWGEFLIRRQTDGTGYRYNALFDRSGANSSVWPTFSLPAGPAWRHIAMVYDGRQAPTQRVRWFVDCVEVVDTEREGIPARLTDTSGPVTIGDGQSRRRSFEDGLRDVAIWPQVLTDEQLLRVCRSRSDLASLGGVPAPRYFVRPRCDDDTRAPGGVANLGVLGGVGTGIATEGDERVIDRSGACDGVDGGVRDGGTTRDGGARDGGVPAEVPNIFGVACDGVDDRVTFGAQSWFDGHDEALVCLLVRRETAAAGGRAVGHWGPVGKQWSVGVEESALRASSAANGAERYAATAEGTSVAGPHEHYCVRWDLSREGVAEEVEVWRNGVATPSAVGVGGPSSVFGIPGGAGFAICGNHAGGELWTGTVDEIAIWFDGNIPTDAQIANELTVDATPWDCALPNVRAGGRPTAPGADLTCRLESTFECVDANGAVALTGTPAGGVTFTTQAACRGVYDNYTSLPLGPTSVLSTESWIQDPTDQNVVMCWTQERSAPSSGGKVMGQSLTEGHPDNSWSIAQYGEQMLVNVFTGGIAPQQITFSVAPTGRHDYCAVFNLGAATPTDRVRLVEDCAPAPRVSGGENLPTSFRYSAGAKTTVGVGFGTPGDVRIDNIVVWREQDGEPSYQDVLGSVCGRRKNYAALPNVPPPGCWFTLDGTLADRLTNCSDLTPANPPVTWGDAAPLD